MVDTAVNVKRLGIGFDGAQHPPQSDVDDDTVSVSFWFLDDFDEFRRFPAGSDGFGLVSAKFGALHTGEMHGPTWPAGC